MTLVLASKNQLKANAILRFRDSLLTVETTTDYCQPLGEAQAKHCIKQRLAQAAQAYPDASLFVALENYVFMDGEYWLRDACMLGVSTDGKPDNVYFSETVPEQTVLVPKKIGQEFTRHVMCGKPVTETIGQRMAAVFPGVDAADWFLVAGAPFDRTGQMERVIADNRAWLDLK